MPAAGGGLQSWGRAGHFSPFAKRAAEADRAIEALVTGRDYPCLAALRSYRAKEYQLGIYGELASESDDHNYALGSDLLSFIRWQAESRSTHLSFWAVFEPGRAPMSEEDFEDRLWEQLSQLASLPDFHAPWDPRCSSEPSDESFCFSFAGKACFVVGLHPEASRKSRRFPWPALVFNLFEQFDELKRDGRYDPLVRANRALDLRYEGSVNPMAEQYGERWESIQFSGRRNGAEWKCPFRHLAR